MPDIEITNLSIMEQIEWFKTMAPYGAKSLPESHLILSHLDPWEQILKFSKCFLQILDHFVQALIC